MDGGGGYGAVIPTALTLANIATMTSQEPRGGNGEQGGKKGAGKGRKKRRRRQGQPQLPEGSAPGNGPGCKKRKKGWGGSETPPWGLKADGRLETSCEGSSLKPGPGAQAHCTAEHRDSGMRVAVEGSAELGQIVPKVGGTKEGGNDQRIEGKAVEHTRRKRKRKRRSGSAKGIEGRDYSTNDKTAQGDSKRIKEGAWGIGEMGGSTGEITSYIRRSARANKRKLKKREARSRAMQRPDTALVPSGAKERKRDVSGGTWNVRG